MSNIKGLWFIVRMYLKRLIRECLKAIWKFLIKKRFIQSYKKKKAILLVFLVIVDIHILNGLINDLTKPEVIVYDGALVSADSQVISNGIEEQQDLTEYSGESVPQAVREWDGVAEVSAYSPRVEETDGSPCISADNTNICEFEGCAIATNDYPLGSKIELKGFGECVVKDRMNSRYTGKGVIDVFMSSYEEAINFGRQKLEFEVIS